jgi:cell division protein FtsB
VRWRPPRWVWLAGPLLLALVAWGWWAGSTRVRETRRELAGLQERKQELETSRRALAREVQALREEREARVRAARDALDVAAPGEVLVVVQPTATPAVGRDVRKTAAGSGP